MAQNRPSREQGTSSVVSLQDKSKCAECGDTGWVAVLDDGATMPISSVSPGEVFSARECICSEKRRALRVLRSSRITEEFQRLGFRNFSIAGRPQAVRIAYEVAKEYNDKFAELVDDRCNSIALLGRPGCGKTHLLMAVCNNLMRKGIEVLYFPWVEGMNELRDDMDDLERRVGVLRKVEVLYIDDLFKGRKEPTPFALEQLFGIINYRYLNHKPILVSSEKTVDQLCEIDEGVGSRIYEMARNYTVLMSLTPEEKASGMQLNYRLR
ncbi:ATP-binding protein [Alicyclobacillus fastidiosus]|uniref:ATP-binding protein n=1 Tax=Alicyclobacillus fastidiosus TaxID=392011 RepID=UPI003D6708D5